MTPAVEMQLARENQQQTAIDNINNDQNIQALKDTFFRQNRIGQH